MNDNYLIFSYRILIRIENKMTNIIFRLSKANYYTPLVKSRT